VKVQRRLLADVPAETYARLAGGSFFASPGFLALWRVLGGRAVAWTIEVDGALGAILPGIEFGSGPFARFQAMPDGCYGGLFLDPALAREREALSRAMFLGLPARHYAKAFFYDFHGMAPSHPGFEVERCETSLVDISDPDWQPADRKLQSQIRKAEREGIEVVPFDWERHHAGFLALTAQTARGHGLHSRYPAAFFRRLADLALRDRRVRWLWCEHDGSPACSHIYFVHAGTVQAWQSCVDRRFSWLKPNQFVRFQLCREVAREGVRWLNLGSTPATSPGLAYFKARWGGGRVGYSSYVRREGLGLLVGRPRRATPARGTPIPHAPELVPGTALIEAGR
jgi:hypothetical protein